MLSEHHFRVLLFICFRLLICCFVLLAVPAFIEGGKPVNVNATDGEDVLFHCETDAEPPAEITWYMNSEKLTGK